jgi:hypothetical protein
LFLIVKLHERRRVFPPTELRKFPHEITSIGPRQKRLLAISNGTYVAIKKATKRLHKSVFATGDSEDQRVEAVV